jgi:hypothetical protein
LARSPFASRARDREAAEGERIRYSLSILPRSARRSKSLEVLIPVLYLKGLSAGDFEEALAAFVGKDAPSRSAPRAAPRGLCWRSEEHQCGGARLAGINPSSRDAAIRTGNPE